MVRGEPYAHHLGDGVRELRPTIDGAPIRITYWLPPEPHGGAAGGVP
ncbi:hypothetical protein [Streptomyces sp. NPDC006274]